METISFTFFDHERLHTWTPPRQSRVARPCGVALTARCKRPASAARARHPTAPRGDGVASAAWPCTAGATAQTPQRPNRQHSDCGRAEIALFDSLRRANGNSCPPIRPGTQARAAPPLDRKARIAVGREHTGSHLRPGVDVVERLVRQHVVEADAPVGCAASAREDPVLVR